MSVTKFSKIQWGDGLMPTDQGEGVLRVDGAGGVGPAGPPGPPGADGPQGPPGPPGTGGDLSYAFAQLTASSVWTIAHGLGKFGSVSVIDSAGTELIPDVNYLDANTIKLTFGAATSGHAYIN